MEQVEGVCGALVNMLILFSARDVGGDSATAGGGGDLLVVPVNFGRQCFVEVSTGDFFAPLLLRPMMIAREGATARAGDPLVGRRDVLSRWRRRAA